MPARHVVQMRSEAKPRSSQQRGLVPACLLKVSWNGRTQMWDAKLSGLSVDGFRQLETSTAQTTSAISVHERRATDYASYSIAA